MPNSPCCALISGAAELHGKRMGRTAYDLHVLVGRAAMLDAGLPAAAIDGVLTGQPVYEADPSFGMMVAEGLGIGRVRYAQTVQVGGASPCAMLNLAARAVTSGWCHAVLVIYADNRLTATADGAPVVERPVDAVHSEFERPLGPTIPALYAMAATRHMHLYCSRAEQFAAIAVQARSNALRTEGAVMTKPITIDDVLASRPIAAPLRLLDCCLFTDFAGAVIVTSAALAADGRRPRIAVLGGGEGHTHAHLTMAPDLLTGGAAIAGQTAFAQAGLTPAEVDFVQLYDCFTIAVALQLEELGFCARGEGPAFAASGVLAPDGRLPFNTNGGMLSFHNGGIYHITEAVRQLRGEAGERQLDRAKIGLVHGNGGVFSHHATVILATQ